jgi:multidrug resistance efflux pump
VLARLDLLNPEARQAELARAEQELLAARQALDTLQDPQAAAQRIAQAKFDLASFDQQIATLQDQVNEENDLSEPDALLLVRLAAQMDLLTAQVASAQALLDKIGADGVDPLALEAAETRLQTAQTAQAAALAALQPVELKAPWDGTLSSLNLVVGQSVSAGLRVATLADFSDWVVKTDNLTEIEVVGLQVGQEVALSLDALPEVELAGKIAAIRSQYEEKRGDITYTVTIALDEVDPQAKWGMTAAVVLDR